MQHNLIFICQFKASISVFFCGATKYLEQSQFHRGRATLLNDLGLLHSQWHVFFTTCFSMHDWNCTDCILAPSCFGASGCVLLESLRFPCSFQACYTHVWVSFRRPRSKACSFIISDHAVSNVETSLNIKEPWNILRVDFCKSNDDQSYCTCLEVSGTPVSLSVNPRFKSLSLLSFSFALCRNGKPHDGEDF